MPIQPTLPCGSLSEAAVLRRQADQLLQRLQADRESSEQRLAASGKRDPLKTVTGATALERAIVSTRSMIAEMDLLLADLDSGITSAEPARHDLAPAPLPRFVAPARKRSGGMLFGQRPVAASA